MRWIGALSISLAVGLGCGAGEAELYAARGTVTAVEAGARRIDHEAIVRVGPPAAPSRYPP